MRPCREQLWRPSPSAGAFRAPYPGYSSHCLELEDLGCFCPLPAPSSQARQGSVPAQGVAPGRHLWGEGCPAGPAQPHADRPEVSGLPQSSPPLYTRRHADTQTDRHTGTTYTVMPIIYRHTDTGMHIHAHTETQRYTDAPPQTCRHIRAREDRQTCKPTQTHTHRDIRTDRHAHKHRHTDPQDLPGVTSFPLFSGQSSESV